MGLEIGDGSRHGRIGRSPLPGGMRAMSVEVGPEIEQLVFEIRARPEQRAIQTLPPYRSVLWRSPLCGAEPGAPRQTLVPLCLSTT